MGCYGEDCVPDMIQEATKGDHVLARHPDPQSQM